MCKEIEVFFSVCLGAPELRCRATPQPVLLRTVFTVQNTEVDTFSSEPLLNFIVVENIVIIMNKTILLLFMFMLYDLTRHRCRS